MFIQIEDTPNPLTLKYIPGKVVLEQGTLSVTTKEQAEQCELTHQLFEISGVVGVFLGSDFISVTKDTKNEWDLLKPQIIGTIMNYFMDNSQIIIKQSTEDIVDQSNKDKIDYSNEEQEIVKEIQELINERIRPAVAQDGGDIVFNKFVKGIVYLELFGACSGCPQSTVTLKNGIENMLKHYIPEVQEVRAL